MNFFVSHFADVMALLNSIGVFIVALHQKPRG